MTKLKIGFMLILIYSLNGCQSELDLQKQSKNNTSFSNLKYIITSIAKKIHKLSYLNSVKIDLDNLKSNYSKKKLTVNSTEKIDQIPTPYLPPNGKGKEDVIFIDRFFNILEMQEALRDLLDHYNKFTIHTNLIFLTHPAQIYSSDDFIRLIKFRKIILKEIAFVRDEILNYNNTIDTHFPQISYHHKMAGYYSFDNTHKVLNQDEFSITEVSNMAFNYHFKLIDKNILKLKNPKLKLHKPEVGKRRGTVFITPGKPNIIRGVFGNDFGAYNLGLAVGMTIEYAITGKIYYYQSLDHYP